MTPNYGMCPEMLKALDIAGLFWLTHLFNVTWSHMEVGDSAVSPSLIIGVLHCSASLGKTQGQTQSRGESVHFGDLGITSLLAVA